MLCLPPPNTAMDLVSQLDTAVRAAGAYGLEGQEGLLVVAQAVNRIAEALEGAQEPPAPSGTPAAPEAAPGGSKGWITDRAPEEGDGNREDCVEVLPRDAQGGWVNAPVPWSFVYPGTPWRHL